MTAQIDLDAPTRPMTALHTRAWPLHTASLALAISGLLLMFGGDVADIVGQWLNSSTYGHCVFVLPIVVWLLWERWPVVREVEPRAWLPGLGFVALAAVTWRMGDAAGISLVRHTAMVAMMPATVLTIMGPSVVRATLFPLFYLVFLVPFGDEIVPTMQALTASIVMALLALAQIPATIDSVFITTPDGWFVVAEACSGVRFLVAMVAFGALIANQCFRTWPRRAAFMAFSIGVSVLANGMRAFATIFAAHLTDVTTATGFDHIVYGWIFFALTMAFVFLLGRPFFEASATEAQPSLQRSPLLSSRNPLAIAALTLATAAIFPLWSTAIAARVTPMPYKVVLPAIDGWQRVENQGGRPWVPRFDGADHRLYGRYRNDRGASVDVAIGLYSEQGRRRSITSQGQGAIDGEHGWRRTSTLIRREIGVTDMIRTGETTRFAVSRYVVGGAEARDVMAVKLRTLRTRLIGGDQAAASIIVSAEDPDGQAAVASFMLAFGSVERHAQALIDTARGQ